MEENNVINEESAGVVISILTNSKAYQCYRASKNSLSEICKKYATAGIDKLEKFINNECITKGWLGASQVFNYGEKYKVGRIQYLTDVEIEYIENYFKNDGFQVEHELIYDIKKNFFGKVISQKPIEVKITIWWNFSKYEENNDGTK